MVIRSDQKVALISFNARSRWGSKGHDSLSNLWANMLDMQTNLLKQLSPCGLLKRLPLINTAPWSCPEGLTGKRTPFVLEPKEQDPPIVIKHKQA